MRPMKTARKETDRRVMEYKMRRRVKRRGAMLNGELSFVAVTDSLLLTFWDSGSQGC